MALAACCVAVLATVSNVATGASGAISSSSVTGLRCVGAIEHGRVIVAYGPVLSVVLVSTSSSWWACLMSVV